MNGPLVSIVIPTIDRRALLCETIESIRAQTYQNWEAIVCDDGSKDDTIAAITELSQRDSRVRLLQRMDDRRGAPLRRNQGFNDSRGKYVIFLDDDDLLDANCLAHRLPIMEGDPSLDFAVFPCSMFVDRPGDEKLLWNAEKSDDVIERFLRLDVPWQTTGPIWRRDSLVRLGPWEENLPSWQDWEFHIRALILGFKYKWIPEIDFYYRLGRGKRQKIGANAMSAKHLLSREPMLTRVLHLMQKTNALTQRRHDLVAGLYFWIAQGLANRELRHEALKVWSVCRHEGLISARKHAEGVMYFRAGQVGKIQRMMKQYLLKFWPEEFRFVFNKHSTFMNAPLTPVAAGR